jgi:hypothetical protein
VNATETLGRLRRLARDVRVIYTDPESTARVFVDLFEALDSHLSAGGRPPEAWSEGPDEPYMDDEPGGIVSVEVNAAGDLVVGLRDDDYTPAGVDATDDDDEELPAGYARDEAGDVVRDVRP